MQLDLNSKPIALAALRLASGHHAGIKRKYTGEPYIKHPVRVAQKIMQFGIHDQLAIAAALLHDCVEDDDIHGDKMSIGTIAAACGPFVADLVTALTCSGGGNRAERKARYHTKIARSHLFVKNIKCADVIDNVQGIVALDPNFAPTYLAEKASLAAMLKPGMKNLPIFQELQEVLALQHNLLAMHYVNTGKEEKARRVVEDYKLNQLADEIANGAFADCAVF